MTKVIFVLPERTIEADLMAETAAEVKPTIKRWEPEINESYYYINDCGVFSEGKWGANTIDLHRKSIGNVYKALEKRLAKWEQVTKPSYDLQLEVLAEQSWLDIRDEIDWNDHKQNKYYCFWIQGCRRCLTSVDITTTLGVRRAINTPYFATMDSCNDAYRKVLGPDSQQYFTGVKEYAN